MAEIEHAYFETVSSQYVSATDWTTFSGYTLGAGEFTAGAKYLILCKAAVNGTNVNALFNFRLAHGAGPTAFTDAEWTIEPTSAAYAETYTYMTVWTQETPAEDVVFQGSTTDARYSARVHWATITAIRLDADLVADADYFYEEATTDVTHTEAEQTFASLTIDSGGEDFLILAHSVFAANNDRDRVRYILYDPSSNGHAWEMEPEDTDEIRGGLWGHVYTVPSGSQTYTVKGLDTGSLEHNVQLSTRIFALRLGAFSNSSANYDATEYSFSGTVPETLTSTDITVTANDHLIVGGYSWYAYKAAAYASCGAVYGGVDVVPYEDTTFSLASNDAADRIAAVTVGIEAVSLGTHTFGLWAEVTQSRGTYQYANIAVICLELSGVSAGKRVNAGALAVSATPVAPTLPAGATTLGPSAITVSGSVRTALLNTGAAALLPAARAVSATPATATLVPQQILTPSALAVTATPVATSVPSETTTFAVNALAVTASVQAATAAAYTEVTASALAVTATPAAVTLGRETLTLPPSALAVTVTLGSPEMQQQIIVGVLAVGITMASPVPGAGSCTINVSALSVALNLPGIGIGGPSAVQWAFPDEGVGTPWTARLNPANYPTGTVFIFECVIKSESVAYSTYCRLYNATTGQPVSGSEVSTTETKRQFLRSNAFSLPSGEADYRAQIGNITGEAGWWHYSEVYVRHT